MPVIVPAPVNQDVNSAPSPEAFLREMDAALLTESSKTLFVASGDEPQALRADSFEAVDSSGGEGASAHASGY